jgi:NH3-dependent NAD+ synthetase
MTSTQMSDIATAKWFVVLGLSGGLDMSFVKSILDKTGELTESQSASLKKCVESLKMAERVNKFDVANSTPYLADEVEFDEDSICSATNTILDDVNVIVSEGKFYGVEAWKLSHKSVKPKTDKPTKQKKKLSDLTA